MSDSNERDSQSVTLEKLPASALQAGQIQGERPQQLLTGRRRPLVKALEENECAWMIAIDERGIGRQQQQIGIARARLERRLRERQIAIGRLQMLERADEALKPEVRIRLLPRIVGRLDNARSTGAALNRPLPIAGCDACPASSTEFCRIRR